MENSEKNSAADDSGAAENKDGGQSPDNKNELEQTASLEDAETTLNGISDSIENQINLQDLETTELKVKVICLEKNNVALKMELKCSELQLEAKTKVDAQKTRLIELLDKKVQSLQKKNNHLMDMFETLLKDKNAQSHNLLTASKNMEELTTKLTESERMRSELRNMNQELKMMLGNIEDKGTQIAKVAKEKILKYKAETLKAQQELSDMIKSASDIPEEAGAATNQPSEKFQQNWKKINDLLQQIVAALQDTSAGSPTEIVTNISKDIKQELEQIQTEINTLLKGNQDRNEKLLSLLESIKLLVLDLKQLGQNNDHKTSEDSGNKDKSLDKDQEILLLQEKLSQFNVGIAKLSDIFASI